MTQPEDGGNKDRKRGILSRLGSFFTRPSTRYGMGFLLLAG